VCVFLSLCVCLSISVSLSVYVSQCVCLDVVSLLKTVSDVLLKDIKRTLKNLENSEKNEDNTKIYKELNKKLQLFQGEDSKLEEIRRKIFTQSIKDLALLFLSALLAIASCFLLIQAGIQSSDYATIAAVSFGVGLATDTVISRLENFVGVAIGKEKSE